MAETDTADEPQIKTIEEYHEQAPRRWPMLVVYIIIALVVAVLLVFGARAIYRHYHHPAAVKTVPANTKQLPSAPPPSASSNSSGAGSGSKSGSSASGQTAGGNLPNSGPGQVVALFVGSSLAAAGAHFLINMQREKQSS